MSRAAQSTLKRGARGLLGDTQNQMATALSRALFHSVFKRNKQKSCFEIWKDNCFYTKIKMPRKNSEDNSAPNIPPDFTPTLFGTQSPSFHPCVDFRPLSLCSQAAPAELPRQEDLTLPITATLPGTGNFSPPEAAAGPPCLLTPPPHRRAQRRLCLRCSPWPAQAGCTPEAQALSGQTALIPSPHTCTS